MCIRLIRIHSCLSATREPIKHKRQWLIRCSMAPTMQSTAESARPQLVSETSNSLYLMHSCIVDPDEITEECDGPCDGCTGRSPLHAPTVTASTTKLSYQVHLYKLTEGLQSWDGFVRNYYRSLMRTLTAHFYYRALDLPGPMTDRGSARFPVDLKRLIVSAMPELACKFHPDHGFYNAHTEGGCPPCGCPPGNPAEAVRRRAIAFPLLEPFMPLLKQGDTEYTEEYATWASAAADIIWSDRKRERLPAGGARIATEAVRTLDAEEIAQRANTLKDLMDGEAHWGCRSPLKPNELRRRLFSHIACNIMAMDVGLTIERARIVAKEMMPLVQPAYKIKECRLNDADDDVDRVLCTTTGQMLDMLAKVVGKTEDDLWIGLFEIRWDGGSFEDAADTIEAVAQVGRMTARAAENYAWHIVGGDDALKRYEEQDEAAEKGAAKKGKTKTKNKMKEKCSLCRGKICGTVAPYDRPVVYLKCKTGDHKMGMRCHMRNIRGLAAVGVFSDACPFCSSS